MTNMIIEYRFRDKVLHKYLKKYLDAVLTPDETAADGRVLLLTDDGEKAGTRPDIIVFSDSSAAPNVISLPVRRKEVAERVRQSLSREIMGF